MNADVISTQSPIDGELARQWTVESRSSTLRNLAFGGAALILALGAGTAATVWAATNASLSSPGGMRCSICFTMRRSAVSTRGRIDGSSSFAASSVARSLWARGGVGHGSQDEVAHEYSVTTARPPPFATASSKSAA